MRRLALRFFPNGLFSRAGKKRAQIGVFSNCGGVGGAVHL